MLNLILFGPPGSGKGTQSERLLAKYRLLHISTGDLFRAHISQGTELGLQAKHYIDQGQLVPDSVTIGMLRDKLEQHPEVAGVIFDGFPRTVAQAQALDQMLADRATAVSALIALHVPDDELRQRLLQRGATSGRSDDQDLNIINSRIAEYKAKTTPVADYYAAQNKAITVHGVGTIDDIFNDLCRHIDALPA